MSVELHAIHRSVFLFIMLFSIAFNAKSTHFGMNKNFSIGKVFALMKTMDDQCEELKAKRLEDESFIWPCHEMLLEERGTISRIYTSMRQKHKKKPDDIQQGIINLTVSFILGYTNKMVQPRNRWVKYDTSRRHRFGHELKR